ncbi:MAG: conjugative transposon protein TraJ [Candidatus Pedobacter colombiensis]|uniref:Conjugative transposon protein TraJ n=1 Tax=Candidatus Pedobacter colombiensis TaxID=3121371 RepID=A0AAJ5W9X3_9SPHI|nr:conjugative transposon protein TraJ [Pedobacter sp.]WEK20435.1 MAG: conjugative transposon protein TraJ [Pedobacter sp.]
MRNRFRLFFGVFVFALVVPRLASAQDGLAGQIAGLQGVLDRVHTEMLPLCSGLIGAGRAIAGFGALWYIANRVWRQLAAAEPIDFYPLMRPFALGMAIVLFPAVMGVFNGVLQVTIAGTQGMVRDSDKAIKALLAQKERELKKSVKYKLYVGVDGDGNRAEWYKYTHPKDPDGSDEGLLEGIGNDIKFWADRQDYKMRHSFKQFMSEFLEILYQAAALCINTLRVFFLIVLAVLGPLVLGFAVFDGLQHTLSVWIARYINIFLWLPIANIFGAILGKIQQNMLRLDIAEVANQGDTFFSSTDLAYLIFMIIGIAGYCCVPTVANYVIHAGGGNSILTKVNTMVSGGSMMAQRVGNQSYSGAKEGAGMIVDRFDDARRNLSSGMAEAAGSDYFKDKVSGR